MLEVPVYNTNGEKVEDLQVDEQRFGMSVNVDLLKQAIVSYQASRRQGSAKTKSRGEIEGTTKKMYRQKGTGNARHGNRKAPILRKGGHAFAKRPNLSPPKLPRKMKKAALNSALLAKMVGGDFCVLDGLSISEPKTKQMAEIVANLEINRPCLLATAERDRAVYLSGRNLPDLTIRTVDELNAYDVAMRQRMVVTREAFDALCGQEVTA